eukprot:4147771-Karenia_brevis.AAC.1
MHLARALGAQSIEGVSTELYSTNIRVDLLQAWASQAHDPAQGAAAWFRDGAPAGITEHIPDWGIFPLTDKDCTFEVAHDCLATNFESFTNYTSVDDDPAAEMLIAEMLEPSKKWV